MKDIEEKTNALVKVDGNSSDAARVLSFPKEGDPYGAALSGARAPNLGTTLRSVPPAMSIERVKDYSGFSAAEHPSNSDQLMVGDIDVVSEISISGWVQSPKEPQLRLELTLMNGSTPLKTAVADKFRQDLQERDDGDGYHGFVFNLADQPLTAGEHLLSIVSSFTGRHMPGSPFRVEISGPRLAKTLQGHVDAVTDTEVSGWVYDREEPTQRSLVRLVEGDRTLARARAEGFRQDLRDAGIGDGRYAFVLPMPRSLIDGQEHELKVVEEKSGASIHEHPLRWRSAIGASTEGLSSLDRTSYKADAGRGLEWINSAISKSSSSKAPHGQSPAGKKAANKLTILVDLSDLVYYIGHHDNLTGIQRVQSSIVLAMTNSDSLADTSIAFISYYSSTRKWMVIPFSFMISLLNDLFYPKEMRRVSFNPQEARNGLLPNSVELEKSNTISASVPSVLCLLGAAWVQRDYFNRVLSLKRNFQTKFVMLVHDLIPIYARDTCDQGTAQVFESFFSRAMRHVDQYLCVSENTAKDLREYLKKMRARVPEITVTKLGGAFGEFITDLTVSPAEEHTPLPERFVLFVSTIEGRKNHQFIFDVWRSLLESGVEPPTLLCVGRVGWKAESFIADLVETNYLGGRVVLLEDVSDAQLQRFYNHCLFTVFPSVYEGWGLPVGESLSYGKVCVSSDRASIPEVAGEFGVYIDIADLEKSTGVIRELFDDHGSRSELERNIRNAYKPTTWDAVAKTVLRSCEIASKIEWTEPYPFAEAPYSSEIGFSWLTRNLEGTFGGDLLARTLSARQPHILFEPLSEQSILLGEDARSFGRWAEPEHWGCWLCEGAGEIVVSLPPEPSRYYYLFLRMRAAGLVSQSKVRLSVNGELGWENVVGEQPRNVVIRVMRKSNNNHTSWRMTVRADIDLSEEMRVQIASIDSRIPTVGFERMAVIPENDTRARLDSLTKIWMEKGQFI